jgi:hypothetical protein
MAGGSVLALVFGMIGACLSLNLFENSSHAAAPGPRAPSRAPAARAGEPDSDVKALKTQLETLAQRVDSLKQRIDDIPKGEPNAGLSMLQIQVADLTKAAREASPLPAQVEKVNQQLTLLSQEIGSLRSDISDVQTRIDRASRPASGIPTVADVPKPAAEAPKPSAENPAAPAPPPQVVDLPKPDAPAEEDDDSQWKRAVGLFKKSNFKDALEVFDRLELTRPDDARVWYFAALCRGFTTGEWSGGTEDLAEKGVEREQAGTPSASEIDRAFRGLNTSTGKDWLAAYRARAKKP